MVSRTKLGTSWCSVDSIWELRSSILLLVILHVRYGSMTDFYTPLFYTMQMCSFIRSMVARFARQMYDTSFHNFSLLCRQVSFGERNNFPILLKGVKTVFMENILSNLPILSVTLVHNAKKLVVAVSLFASALWILVYLLLYHIRYVAKNEFSRSCGRR